MATKEQGKILEDTMLEIVEQLKLDGVDVPPLEELKIVFICRDKITDKSQWINDDIELEAILIHNKAIHHNHHTNKLKQSCARYFLCQEDTAIKRVYVSLSKLYDGDSCYEILRLSDKLAEEITVGTKGLFLAMLAEEADALSEDKIIAATCGYIVLGSTPCTKPETWIDAKAKKFYAYIPYLKTSTMVYIHDNHCIIDDKFYTIIRAHAKIKKIMQIHSWEVV